MRCCFGRCLTRLMELYQNNAARKIEKGQVAPAGVEDWNRLSHSFSGVADAYTENRSETTGQLPEQVACAIVSPRFFPVLGTPALRGRGYTADEDQAEGPNVVVISERFWHRRFNADGNVIGRNLRFGSSSWQIAGVMPGIVSFPGSGRGYLD